MKVHLCVFVFNQTHECVVEYATPVLTLYKMSHESTAGFGETERTQQVLLFYRTLQDILERSLECRNRYRLILLLSETMNLILAQQPISGWNCTLLPLRNDEFIVYFAVLAVFKFVTPTSKCKDQLF